MNWNLIERNGNIVELAKIDDEIWMRALNTDTGRMVTVPMTLGSAAAMRDHLNEMLEPQKFYLKLFDSTYGYVNKLRNMECATGQYMSSTDREGTSSWQTQFTQEEIDSDPELKKFEAFKIPVEDVE